MRFLRKLVMQKQVMKRCEVGRKPVDSLTKGEPRGVHESNDDGDSADDGFNTVA